VAVVLVVVVVFVRVLVRLEGQGRLALGPRGVVGVVGFVVGQVVNYHWVVGFVVGHHPQLEAGLVVVAVVVVVVAVVASGLDGV